jgi:hypothetical protein
MNRRLAWLAIPALVVGLSGLAPPTIAESPVLGEGIGSISATRDWVGAASRVDVGELLRTGSRTPPIQRAQALSLTAAGQPASLSLSDLRGTPSMTISQSTNWSGYVVGDGPYTSVTGTFDVPNLVATPTRTFTAEWVGIDGAANRSLIQAGVVEMFDPTTDSVSVAAWWEILPAPITLIPMTVVPGDTVSVTISQVSGTLWGIAMANGTTGGNYTTYQSYSGPQTSAEWIVEAPTSLLRGQTTLGEYRPDVTFSNVGVDGPETTLTQVTMVQGGAAVSTPSTLTATGFSVTYGASSPTPTPTPSPTPTSSPTPTPTLSPTPTPAPDTEVHTIVQGQQFDLRLTGGTPYLQVQWQVSPDLVSWTLLTTVTLDASGAATYTFAPPQTAYYRAFSPSSGEPGTWLIEVVVVPPASRPASPPIPGAVPSYSAIVPPPGSVVFGEATSIADSGVAASNGGAIVHVVMGEWPSSGLVFHSRSTDGGATFSSPVVLSDVGQSGYAPSVATGADGLVVAAWVAPGATGKWIAVTRSLDYGTTWDIPRVLSPGPARPDSLAVAIGRLNRVAVSWADEATHRVTLGVSQDGGATFGSRVTIGTSLTHTRPSLGFAADSLVVAWQAPGGGIVTRRNPTGGRGTWAAPISLDAASSDSGASISTLGSTVVVGFTTGAAAKWRATVRVSTDRGAHWSARRPAPTTRYGEFVGQTLVPKAGSIELFTERQTGKFYVVYVRRSSNGGVTWGPATRVSAGTVDSFITAAARGSRSIVLYYSVSPTFDTTLSLRRL